MGKHRQIVSFIFSFALLVTFIIPSYHVVLAIPNNNQGKAPAGINKSLKKQSLSSIGYTIKNRVLGKTAHSMKNITININENNNTPIFIDETALSNLMQGISKPAPYLLLPEKAFYFINEQKTLFKLDNPEKELRVLSETTSSEGKHHIVFEQQYQNVPVWGHQIVMHFNNEGNLYSINARYSPTPKDIDTTNCPIEKQHAIDSAVTHLSQNTVIHELSPYEKELCHYEGPEVKLYIWVDQKTEKPYLVWYVFIRPNVRDRWHYFIDAVSSEIVDNYNSTPDATSVLASGIDALGVNRSFYVTEDQNVYYMEDLNVNIHTYKTLWDTENKKATFQLIASTTNEWSDSTAISGFCNSRTTYDYYYNQFNRNGVDANNYDLPVIVHYTQDGTPFLNAFWNGNYIVFGDGDRYAAALDVVAHETTHAVVQFTIGLEYNAQSGALNESIADDMACMVDPDWELGEDLMSGAIRDLSNPHRFGLPATMSEYVNLPSTNDNGGVHTNLSIPSRACYLTAQAIGREKTADIWYTVLNSHYLTQQAQFIDMRLGAIQSATDLFGAESSEVTAVKNAFDEVGIIGQESTPPPQNTEPLQGVSHIAFIYPYQGVNYLALGKEIIESNSDVVIPSSTPVFSGGSGPISVAKDGSFLLFVDLNNNLRYLDLKTFDEQIIDNSGDWWSIALSPNGTYLASTTAYVDSTIYILNLDNPDESKVITIYTPTTAGDKEYTALFADALDWNHDSSCILFDAYHEIPVTNGNPVSWWDVNILNVNDEVITRVNTPTESNTQVGNPSYSETNDRYIVCDLYSDQQGICSIVAIDLFTQEINTIKDTGLIQVGQPNLGFPCYSSDDSHIILQHYNVTTSTYFLYKIPMVNNRMSPSGDVEFYYTGGLPVSFTSGTPTAVEEHDVAEPAAFHLNQNSPNPFNPITTIHYTIYKPGQFSLTVYNMLGQEVKTLFNDYQLPGSYTITFDGKSLGGGLYIYQLKSNDYCETKKMILVK